MFRLRVCLGKTFHSKSSPLSSMGKGPGLFSDIGKKAKDLLTRDYNYDQKFMISTCTEDGLGITSTSLNKGGLLASDVETQYKHQNVTINVKLDTNSSVLTRIALEDIVPNGKAILTFKVPDDKSGKFEVQYLHEHVGVSKSVSLAQKPHVDFSAAVGSETFTFGGEVGYDSATGQLTKYNAGIGISKPEHIASVILADKGETLKASYICDLKTEKKCSFAGEISRHLPSNQNTITVGGSYLIDPITTVKARLNNHGKLGALLQHEWQPKSLLTISTEVDTKALDKTPKIGLALALKP